MTGDTRKLATPDRPPRRALSRGADRAEFTDDAENGRRG
jgi:hypothetical protein